MRTHSLSIPWLPQGSTNRRPVTEPARGKIPPGLMLLCMVWILVLLFSVPRGAHARTLTVGKDLDYQSINQALEAAVAGDMIEVHGGRYRERLKITKPVHIKGIERPIISVEAGRIIEITSPGVVVEGLVLKYEKMEHSPDNVAVTVSKEAVGTVIRNNRITGAMFGVWNVEGKNIRIEGNTILGLKHLSENRRGNCINLTGSQRVQIIGNNLSYCRDGIYMELSHDATVKGNEISHSRYSVHTMWVDRGRFIDNIAHENLVGLAIMYSKKSEISRNLSYANLTHGLLFIQTIRSKIEDNKLIGNTRGMFLYNSVFNEIKSNLIMNNQLGIHSWGGSEENSISGNSFIDNEVQIKFVAGRDQEWNRNYWSDYLGWDTTSDNEGDYPYESNTVVDYIFARYPLAKILYTSPALQILRMLEKQFPMFEVPRVLDRHPAMAPLHADWKRLRARYPHKPARFYGEIEKMPHLPGGRH